jgi:hypothetical protein
MAGSEFCFEPCSQTPLPPSTSMLTPVINEPSSLARNNAVFATSIGSVSRPRGTFETNLALFSGVSSTPTKVENKPVPERSGAIALTRMLSGPYSADNPFVACPHSSVFYVIWRTRMTTHICYGAFTSIVPNQSRSRPHTPNTRDIDNTATTLLLHLWHCSQHTQINTSNIDIEHSIKLVNRNL